MNNKNTGKVPPEENSLLRYSGGSSYTTPEPSTSGSEALSPGNTASDSPIQFASRRERRSKELEKDKTLAPPISTNRKTSSSTPTPSNTGATPVLPPQLSWATTSLPIVPQPSSAASKDSPSAKTSPESKVRSAKVKIVEPIDVAPHNPKDYWGGTAILMSMVVFLVAQIIASIAVVFYILFGTDFLKSIQGGTQTVEEIMSDVPWLLILSLGLMYVAWFGCLWWVTKYRSGVQGGKKFWNAFKDNFRLTSFKYIDIAWGAGAAAVMLGFQYLVLNVLPKWFPSLNIEEAGNTGIFESLDGIWFYLIAFGLGGLLGPICEELFFRGFLLKGFSNHFSFKNIGRNMDIVEDGLSKYHMELRSMLIAYRAFTHKHRYLLASIISSIAFGLIHYQGGTSFASWLTVIMTGLLGLVFALMTTKLNRLYPAIIGHVLYNSSLFVVLATQRG